MSNHADTPMLRQYRELRAQVPDALLFYRMGDFYELFGEDAVWTAAALELTLTTRDRDTPDPLPMCGVPWHSAGGYVRRLLDLGKKVAIAEQVGDPKPAKGIVHREIARVLTPGLAADGIDAHESSFLVAITGVPGAWGLAFFDASTGELRAADVDDLAALSGELARHSPREALIGRDTDSRELRTLLGDVCTTVIEDTRPDRAELSRRFGVGADTLGPGLGAASTALRYAAERLKADLRNVTALRTYRVAASLGLDEATIRNLELFRPLRGTGRKGTLLGLLDRTKTAMGGRLLRDWIGRPLLEVDAIEARLDAVEAATPGLRDQVVPLLGQVADLERIAGKLAQGLGGPRDLVALGLSLQRVATVATLLDDPRLAGRLADDLAGDVATDILTWLVDDPPVGLDEGGFIVAGVDPALDKLRRLGTDAKGAIAEMEERLRRQTEIGSLKIRHNAVFGYYIEITKAHLHRVPPAWHRKQTIANGERFITPELKEYEEAVSGADEKRIRLEGEHFRALRARVAEQVPRVQTLARGVAELDVLTTFAELAAQHRWTRPTLEAGVEIELVGSRHPVVEAARRDERFVPNDLKLGEASRLSLLFGPNMAGKSTLMRQVALTVVMAQVGCPVAARSARLGVVDRLFVRVGASDDLARGQSTFMVEMGETANILAGATSRSLVLLDEIGRGTSTYDGLAIAWAVAEDLHDRIRARTIFATHYHELAALTESNAHARAMHVAVAESSEKITFLRVVRDGPAPGSFGIQCARLAGLPAPVVARASRLLLQLEKKRPRPESTQLSLFGGAPVPEPIPTPPSAPLADPVRLALLALDPDALTPRGALEELYRLRRLAEE
ncbi:MAG: DNA mismatch repair protein MutS [Myxococcales bacterium]|nr:DNA mismatch repair protein MutS [Myxococcales bacterium]